MDWKKVLSVERAQAFNIFLSGLSVRGWQINASDEEIRHVADVLTAFAMGSGSIAAPHQTLYGAPVIDLNIHARLPFNVRGAIPRVTVIEAAAAQTLFIAGFRRAEIVRYGQSVNEFNKLGSHLYRRASCLCEESPKKNTLRRMAVNFPNWTEICFDLNKSLCHRPH